MKHLDLFTGIAGFSIAAQRVWDNYENVGMVDFDPYCQALLKLRFPKAKIHDDIKTYKGTRGSADLITGGFPCQPFSAAGKRKGTEDDRDLWGEMFRIIKEIKPKWVIGENVSGFVTWGEGVVLERTCTDLENEGYEVQSFIIPACAVNAPHRRDRIWIVAHAIGSDDGGRARKDGGSKKKERLQKRDKVGVTSKSGEVRDAINPRRDSRGSDRQERYIQEVAIGKVTKDNKERDRRKHRVGEGDKNAPDGDSIGLEKTRPEQQATGSRGSYRDAPDATSQRGEHGRGGKQRDGTQQQERLSGRDSWNENWIKVATELCGVDAGVSATLDGLKYSKSRHRVERLKGLGNAIVPAVAEQIMIAIKDVD